MALQNQVQLFIEKEKLILPHETVIVGVSGGPDSLCLLHLLRELAPELMLTLHAAHLNHAIRGQAGEADADYVASICRDWQIKYTMERVDVPTLARERKLSLEEAARQVRYAFLVRVAADQEAGVIAVGHNADDQVETVLMHLLRGSGLAGLRGMQPTSHLNTFGQPSAAVEGIRLVRPLLTTTRSEIESYCTAQGLSPRRDLTNDDTTLFRNRLRHELLPILASYNPNINSALLHMSEVAGADHNLLAELLHQVWNRVVVSADADTIRFNLAGFRAQPTALQRALIREGVTRLDHTLRDVSFAQLQNALNTVNQGTTGNKAVLPGGLSLHLSYRFLFLSCLPAIPEDTVWPRFSLDHPVSLPVPGECMSTQDHWRIRCQVRPREQVPSLDTNSVTSILVAQEAICEPLTLATRRPGDCLQPLGMHGQTQKLHDLMINEKVPASERPFVPILRMGDEIVWVVGLRQDQRFAVRETTENVIYIALEHLEEY